MHCCTVAVLRCEWVGQVDSKAKGNDKYPEAVAGLMKEPGMTP